MEMKWKVIIALLVINTIIGAISYLRRKDLAQGLGMAWDQIFDLSLTWKKAKAIAAVIGGFLLISVFGILSAILFFFSSSPTSNKPH